MLKHLHKWSSALFGIVLAASITAGAPAEAEDLWILELESGTITIDLLEEVAPQHVQRIKKLTEEGFYDGTPFHRVIEGFMAQGGDPTGTGTGGSDYSDLQAEFSNIPYQEGTVGMARAQNPHSANSQFFIMLARNDSLNGQYTVIGQVVDGMDIVHQIKKGSGRMGLVNEPDHIVKATIQTSQ
jgi:peptidylprolyl isomerase